MKRPYVVILNWNGWQDTLRCLDSVLRSEGVKPRVIVCDNGSKDESVAQLRAWARGDKASPAGPADWDACPPQPRVWQEVDRCAVEDATAPAHRSEVALIHNRANLGFAGGNNVGLRYALAQSDMEHVWLLNNDTIVAPDCLRRKLARLKAESGQALCGSLLLSMEDPELISAAGGHRLNPLTGIPCAGIHRGRRVADITAEELEKHVDYLCGASILMPREFLEDVGLMEESYFLYYEEADWMQRAAGRWKSVVATDARVYHAEGASIGSGSHHRRPGPWAEAMAMRARLRFMHRHRPRRWCLTYISGWLQVLNRARRREWKNARSIARVLMGGYRRRLTYWLAEHTNH